MDLVFWFFFFFKQKTAYEMLRSLVGSEMCIRDSGHIHFGENKVQEALDKWPNVKSKYKNLKLHMIGCLLYTSDAADE